MPTSMRIIRHVQDPTRDTRLARSRKRKHQVGLRERQGYKAQPVISGFIPSGSGNQGYCEDIANMLMLCVTMDEEHMELIMS
jgi:hypothetical protein